MLCGDGIIGVDMVLLVGCDGLRQLRLAAMLQHLNSSNDLQVHLDPTARICGRQRGASGGAVWRA